MLNIASSIRSIVTLSFYSFYLSFCVDSTNSFFLYFIYLILLCSFLSLAIDAASENSLSILCCYIRFYIVSVCNEAFTLKRLAFKRFFSFFFSLSVSLSFYNFILLETIFFKNQMMINRVRFLCLQTCKMI